MQSEIVRERGVAKQASASRRKFPTKCARYWLHAFAEIEFGRGISGDSTVWLAQSSAPMRSKRPEQLLSGAKQVIQLRRISGDRRTQRYARRRARPRRAGCNRFGVCQ